MKPIRDSYSNGRLTAQPSAPVSGKEIHPGIQPLGLDSEKDGLLYIPNGYTPEKPAALAVMLHGSGGNPEQGMWLLQKYADAYNLILVAPPSRKYTWDVIVSDSFGPDAIYMDQALKLVFENYAVNPDQVAVGGFSDGASYALCMGLTNGDLFTNVIAFSPGFAFSRDKQGSPEVFISHGVHDRVLPIDPCARSVNRDLQRQGLRVNYLEFDGEHEIPANISQAAVDWFLK